LRAVQALEVKQTTMRAEDIVLNVNQASRELAMSVGSKK
jgi:hypothetical protein